ncbi:ABC transporter permease [Paenibacillus sp. N3/727]|uniref:ABC transporter permease n=1 Tax=Paenibacillus sp. N3/727 TaxID=2925845 RepID=UPI001F52E2BD|nr:ABC transporter permease [Paenibacillus sp. N3/727]UNK18691.1 ABC transporter permease [Paenibacillus sp. N3/727]
MKKPFVWLLLPGLLFLTVFMVIPIFMTIGSTFFREGQFTIEGYIKLLSDPFMLKILGTTLQVSAITTIACILIGFPVAYYISKQKARTKGILLALAIFPLMTSAIVRSFSWMVILGKNGLVNQLLTSIGLIDEPMKILYTPTSMMIGLIHLFLPLMIISLVGVMENIDRDLLNASSSLGASRMKGFMTVIVPLCVPGLIVGSILVFVGSLTAYTTPQLLGGKQRVVATFLYQNAMTLNDWDMASIIATVMIVVTFIIIGLMNQLARKLNPKG